LGYIFKISLNENSKIPAFTNCFPELCHNEIQAFKVPDDRFSVLILSEEKYQNDRMEKVINSFIDILTLRKFRVNAVRIEGGDIFEKIMNSLLLFYWTSYFLAAEKGIDPAENELIDEFKENLKK